MRPILFIIPQLSPGILWPLLAIVAVVSLVFAVRAFRATTRLVSREALHATATQTAALSSTRNASNSPDNDENNRKNTTEEGAFNAALGPLGLGAMLAAFLFASSRGEIKLHSYGFMLVIGFGVAAWLSCREAQRRGINPNIILDLSLPLLFISVIFCRVLYILLSPNQFHSLGEMVRIWDGGLSFHGSLVAAPLVVWFYAHRNKLGFGRLADVIAVNAFLGYAIARIGCLLNGCCYGGVCDLPWAIRFPDEHAPGMLTPPSHPAQLYSSFLALGLFFVMQKLKNKPQWNRFSGQLTLLFFAMYAVERFIVEIFRQGATASTVFGSSWMTQAQFASILGLIFLAALYIFLSRKSSTRSNRQQLTANR